MALWQFGFYIVSSEKCAAGVDSNNEDILSWK